MLNYVKVRLSLDLLWADPRVGTALRRPHGLLNGITAGRHRFMDKKGTNSPILLFNMR